MINEAAVALYRTIDKRMKRLDDRNNCYQLVSAFDAVNSQEAPEKFVCGFDVQDGSTDVGNCSETRLYPF